MGVGLRGTTRLALLGLAAAVVGGCGGSDDLSSDEASAKVNAFCRESATHGSEIASGLNTSSDESFLDTLQAQVREKDRLQAQLEDLSLGGPSQPVADYAAAQEREADAAGAAVKAIETDNSVESPAVQQALEKLSSTGEASVEAAEKAELDYCGPLQREIAAAGEPGIDPGTRPQRAASGDAIIPGSELWGTWEGVATQNGPGKHQTLTYPVYFRIDPKVGPDDGNGGIRYDAFDCLGRVRIFQVGSGPDGFGYRYKLREKILAGQENCESGGTITAVTEGDELDWRWNKGNVEVAAILHERGAPRRQQTSEEALRVVQGHEYIGTVTQWGPRGEKGTYQTYYGLYPPGKSPKPGVDGWTLYPDSDPECTGTLTIESVAGDRATLRERIASGGCFDHGLIEARRVGNKLLYRWYRQSDDDRGEQNDVIALGTLSESGPSLGPPPG